MGAVKASSDVEYSWSRETIPDVLSKLDVDEKVELLSGSDFWHTKAIPRLNIPSIRMSDGPNGVRGTRFFNGVPAACFPCGTALAATWDRNLIQEGGRLMGKEAIAKGVHVILGPTMNMQRSPLGGRGFESFSEDPCLSGEMGAATILGIQSTGVAATAKHFVCNDQEHERQAVDSILTERALREIYLKPFEIACETGGPWAIMTAYNRVNGTHVSENKRLLQDVLQEEWLYKGLIMSDWFGTYSAAESINAGLDLEMPGPPRVRGNQAMIALGNRKINEKAIDDRVSRVLHLISDVAPLKIPENAPERTVDCEETSSLLRHVSCSSIVLLKNDSNLLPFDKKKTVAIIGPNAKIACYAGGGSANLRPYYAVTPFDGISAQASHVEYALGAVGYKHLPVLSTVCKTKDDKLGLTATFYLEPPTNLERKAIDKVHVESSDMLLSDYTHPELKGDTFYMDLEGTLTPEEDGNFTFGLTVCGTAKLFVDGELVVDNEINQRQGDAFFGSGTVEEKGSMQVKAGKTYNILVHFGSSTTSKMKVKGATVMAGGGLRLGGARDTEPRAEIAKAVEVAKQVDQVVVCAGLNADWESEGFDRENMDLPGYQNDLIFAVAAANANTAVVMQSGTPVTMPWVDQVPAVVQAWYGGNETGNAIADVLFGRFNPSGKLSLSYPIRNEDNPAFLNFRSERGRVLYGEDIYIGYRFYEKIKRDVLFPFGHGLSYTSFDMQNLVISDLGPYLYIGVEVKNTGAVFGEQVVQVYSSQRTPSINRPPKELRGFDKVYLEPGETRRAKIRVKKRSAAGFWDEERDAWVAEEGVYDILVGDSSANTPLQASFEIEKTEWWGGREEILKRS
ncbi:glycoside hydrolase family 3 protein [Saccharata proteae CBS 121410]|uniref:Probable beta-glucosidase I n=1 Tax=Saccharata proteae CBS 121410 TaxID=1314787 RepID=A0A9P4HTW5_9PEZI|nr:glycoside hydrolase family 3 protein [Saccharata proteae CBS 121410]